MKIFNKRTATHQDQSKPNLFAQNCTERSADQTMHGSLISGFSDPGAHWLHHNLVAKGGAGINYATHYNLFDIVWNTKSDAWLEVQQNQLQAEAAAKEKLLKKKI